MITKWQTLEEFEQSPTKGWCWVTYHDSYNRKTEVDIAHYSNKLFYYDDNSARTIYDTYDLNTITHVMKITLPNPPNNA